MAHVKVHPAVILIPYLALFSKMFVISISVRSVHLMSVTPTPYGATTFPPAGTPSPSFVCLLSPPDTGSIPVDSIATGRQVLRGSGVADNPLLLPSGSLVLTSNENIKVTTMPVNYQSEGVFYCEGRNNGRTTRVPVTIIGLFRK